MQDQILETLQSLKHEVHKRYKAELKGIFGSYTRGEAREDNDIDILVEFRKGATLLDLTGLGNFSNVIFCTNADGLRRPVPRNVCSRLPLP